MISSEVIEKKGSLKIHYGQSFIDIHVQDGEGGRCKRVYLRDQGTYMDEEHVFVGDTKMETTTHDDECRIHLHLSDGSVVSCDTVVCAIGVEPNLDFISNEKREGGGMKKGRMELWWLMKDVRHQLLKYGQLVTVVGLIDHAVAMKWIYHITGYKCNCGHRPNLWAP